MLQNITQHLKSFDPLQSIYDVFRVNGDGLGLLRLRFLRSIQILASGD
jgi:hypothetical protein